MALQMPKMPSNCVTSALFLKNYKNCPAAESTAPSPRLLPATQKSFSLNFKSPLSKIPFHICANAVILNIFLILQYLFFVFGFVQCRDEASCQGMVKWWNNLRKKLAAIAQNLLEIFVYLVAASVNFKI